MLYLTYEQYDRLQQNLHCFSNEIKQKVNEPGNITLVAETLLTNFEFNWLMRALWWPSIFDLAYFVLFLQILPEDNFIESFNSLIEKGLLIYDDKGEIYFYCFHNNPTEQLKKLKDNLNIAVHRYFFGQRRDDYRKNECIAELDDRKITSNCENNNTKYRF